MTLQKRIRSLTSRSFISTVYEKNTLSFAFPIHVLYAQTRIHNFRIILEPVGTEAEWALPCLHYLTREMCTIGCHICKYLCRD